jgi:hypothetical protein
MLNNSFSPRSSPIKMSPQQIRDRLAAIKKDNSRTVPVAEFPHNNIDLLPDEPKPYQWTLQDKKHRYQRLAVIHE